MTPSGFNIIDELVVLPRNPIEKGRGLYTDWIVVVLITSLDMIPVIFQIEGNLSINPPPVRYVLNIRKNNS